ncbi:MAG: hypothetical protein E7520_04275 [Ruminococcaceae bacterium]|nr:hypothetical protein [Oscillospiraceae bacterium]
MFLTDKTNEILQALKGSEMLSDTIVIASFPFAYKPTRLQKCLLTVSPHGMKAEQEGIGESRLFGALQIRLTAFVPQDMGSPVAADVLDRAAAVLAPLHPRDIEMGEIKVRDDLEAFSKTGVFTFTDHMNSGGNNGG